MRVCVVAEGQEGIGWAEWLRLAERCEELGFEALFRSDHYRSTVGAPERDCLDAWSTIAALAGRTERIRLGTLVSPATFRHPSELAKIVATVDHVSGGRVELGLGAGWFEQEHRAFGFAFATTTARNERFREQLEIITRQWSGEQFDFAGEHYRLDGCRSLPRPLQLPRPPIVIGGSGGAATVEAVAAFGDEYNTPYATPARCRELRSRVRVACEAADRDPGEVAFSLMTGFVIGSDRAEMLRHARSVMRQENAGGDIEDFLAGHAEDWIVGSVEDAAARIAEYADAGVDRLYLQHLDHTDDQTLELVARELLPLVTPY
jgi:F420-dependent oxidoreductase-like protein